MTNSEGKAAKSSRVNSSTELSQPSLREEQKEPEKGFDFYIRKMSLLIDNPKSLISLALLDDDELPTEESIQQAITLEKVKL